MKPYTITLLTTLAILLLFSCKSDIDQKMKQSKKIKLSKTKSDKKKKKTAPPLIESKTLASQTKNTEKVSLNSIDYALIDKMILQKINKERRRLSLPPFTIQGKLQQAAKIHNNYMVLNNILDHNEIGTSTPQLIDRVQKAGVMYNLVGENIQYEGFIVRMTNGTHKSIISPTYAELAENLWQNWKNSPPHYKNIINPKFKYLGTSLKWSHQKTAMFATQVYGG